MSTPEASTNSRIIRFLLEFAGNREAAVYLLVIFVMSVLDLAGIAIIFPYIQIVTQPSLLTERIAWLGVAQSPGNEKLILLMSLALGLLYIGKAILQAALLRYQHQHIADYTARLTNDTVGKILNSRYALFQEIPGSEIAGIAYSNTVHATIAFRSLIQIANEAIFLALLCCAFLLVSPLLTLSAIAFLSLVALLLYVLVIRRISRLGKAQNDLENRRYRLLFSIVNAIRDIKVMGLAPLFDRRNHEISQSYADIAWRYNFSGALPLLVIELSVLLGVIASVSVLVFSKLPMNDTLPLLGIASVTAIRTVPAFAKLMMALNSFRFYRSFVQHLMAIRDRMDSLPHQRIEDNLHFGRRLELRNIHFRYGNQTILSDINLDIVRGQSIGIVGPSGAGKSTLLDIITGLQPASSGEYLCDGRPFNPFSSKSLERLVGYVPQSLTLLDESLAFNIAFEHGPSAERLDKALRAANLDALVRTLPDGVNTRLGENGLRVSGGQRQRIGIARALYREPQLLIFDEATSALDAQLEHELSSEINKLRGSITLLIVSHRLANVMDCDRIYVLAAGRLADAGTHHELLDRCALYRELHTLQNILGSEGQSSVRG